MEIAKDKLSMKKGYMWVESLVMKYFSKFR